jgi:hypothetical protein
MGVDYVIFPDLSGGLPVPGRVGCGAVVDRDLLGLYMFDEE